MAKDFDHFQAIGTYKIWEKEFTHSVHHQVNKQVNQDAFLVRESLLSTSDYTQHNQHKSIQFSQIALKEMLDSCMEFTHIVITDNVIYVKDISALTSTPFNTLIFYLNQNPTKSRETSTEIMNRYFESTFLNYSYTKLIGRSIGIAKCCPYVYNHLAYVPEKGPTNAPVSWYAMHHVVYATKHKKSSLTFLHFRNQDELSFDLGKKGYENQLERVIHLFFLQQLFKQRMMAVFHLTELPQNEKELNVIQKRLQHALPLTIQPHSLQQFLNYLLYFKVQELLTKVLGEENPYIEEIMATFKKPPFRFRFHK